MRMCVAGLMTCMTCVTGAACVLVLPGCFLNSGGVDRRSGQVELFQVEPLNQELYRPFDADTSLTAQTQRKDLTQNWGDRLRYGSDSVTLQVHAINLERLPVTITGSKDVVVFAEVWENAAAAYDSKPVTSIVYIGKNQLVPGRMNFNGALAFGPTSFKGTPLKVRFTVMILQKERGQQQAELAEVIGKYASLVPVYGTIASEVIGVIRDMLRAQADVIAFDYEATLLSDNPAPNLTNETSSTGSRGANTPDPKEPRNNGADWSAFDSRVGWLQYGFYALVETRARQDVIIYPFDGQASAMPSRSLRAQWRGGGIYAGRKTAPGITPAGEKPDTAPADAQPAHAMETVKTNYLVFSLTPGQIPQGDDFLRVASDANRSLLGDLRQTKENVATSLESIRQRAIELKGGVVESRLQAVAGRLATQKLQTASVFQTQFNREAEPLIRDALSTETSPQDKAKLEAILSEARTRLENRYKSDLMSLNAFTSDLNTPALQATYDELSNSTVAVEKVLNDISNSTTRLETVITSLQEAVSTDLTPLAGLAAETQGAADAAETAVSAWLEKKSIAKANDVYDAAAVRAALANASSEIAAAEQRLSQARAVLTTATKTIDTILPLQAATAELRVIAAQKFNAVNERVAILAPGISKFKEEIERASTRAIESVKTAGSEAAAGTVESLRRVLELKEGTIGKSGLDPRMAEIQMTLSGISQRLTNAVPPLSDALLTPIQTLRTIQARIEAASQQIQAQRKMVS